jgi:hypothetical protein
MEIDKEMFILWPRKVITHICDEIPTKAKLKGFCKVKRTTRKINGKKLRTYFSIPLIEE